MIIWLGIIIKRSLNLDEWWFLYQKHTPRSINQSVLSLLNNQGSILRTGAVVGWWRSVVCWFDVYSQWPPSPGRCGHELEQWQHQQHCLQQQQQQQGPPPVCSGEAWWLTACREESWLIALMLPAGISLIFPFYHSGCWEGWHSIK